MEKDLSEMCRLGWRQRGCEVPETTRSSRLPLRQVGGGEGESGMPPEDTHLPPTATWGHHTARLGRPAAPRGLPADVHGSGQQTGSALGLPTESQRKEG